jgi:hypothetical protein
LLAFIALALAQRQEFRTFWCAQSPVCDLVIWQCIFSSYLYYATMVEK